MVQSVFLVKVLSRIKMSGSFYDEQDNAQKYAQLPVDPIGTTGYLSTRDVSTLLKKHINNQFYLGMKTLDYGCGVGRSTRYLKQYVGLTQVVGADINAKMLNIAKANDKEGIYELIKSGQTSFKDAAFDFVYSSFVIVEISTKTEIACVFQEIYRLLKPFGFFMLVTASEDFFNTRNNWITYNHKYPENENLKSGSQTKFDMIGANLTLRDYYWTDNDIVELAMQASFSVAEIHKPLGEKKDNIAWLSESEVPPFSIYMLQKNR